MHTSTESWSVRGMIWTVYKHWSAPSFEKMFLTVIDSEKSRTMSPSPDDRFEDELIRNVEKLMQKIIFTSQNSRYV